MFLKKTKFGICGEKRFKTNTNIVINLIKDDDIYVEDWFKTSDNKIFILLTGSVLKVKEEVLILRLI